MEVFPVEVFGGNALLYHGDAIGNGAHELAKVAAYAFFFFYCIGLTTKRSLIFKMKNEKGKMKKGLFLHF